MLGKIKEEGEAMKKMYWMLSLSLITFCFWKVHNEQRTSVPAVASQMKVIGDNVLPCSTCTITIVSPSLPQTPVKKHMKQAKWTKVHRVTRKVAVVNETKAWEEPLFLNTSTVTVVASTTAKTNILDVLLAEDNVSSRTVSVVPSSATAGESLAGIFELETSSGSCFNDKKSDPSYWVCRLQVVKNNTVQSVMSHVKKGAVTDMDLRRLKRGLDTYRRIRDEANERLAKKGMSIPESRWEKILLAHKDVVYKQPVLFTAEAKSSVKAFFKEATGQDVDVQISPKTLIGESVLGSGLVWCAISLGLFL